VRSKARGACVPDALILDIGVSDMDGNEICRRPYGIPETSHATYIAPTEYRQAYDRSWRSSWHPCGSDRICKSRKWVSPIDCRAPRASGQYKSTGSQ